MVLNRGLELDTVQQGRLNFAGGGSIKLPMSYSQYRGVGYIQFDGKEAMNLIINKEQFSISEESDKRYKFENSPENEYLYGAQKAENASNNLLYAQEVLGIARYVEDLRLYLSGKENLHQNKQLLDYALTSINYESLYTSGLWYYVIDGLFKLHGDQESLSRNMIGILGKINSQEVYECLTENIITVTQQYALDDAFDTILTHVKDSGKIETPTRGIYKAFNLVKVRKGQEAPSIKGLANIDAADYEKSLIVFYQEGCDNCEKEMALLEKAYPLLKEKRIRVIAISGDEDEKDFAAVSKNFSWRDTICDYQGFSGENFINFGIMATPTFFVIDKDWKVLGRYAQYSQINIEHIGSSKENKD